MRVLVVTVQVPFVRGGAEWVAEGLRHALVDDGHEAEIVAIPFKWYPPDRILDHMLACRLLDVTDFMGGRVDRVITLKFPAYLVKHPHKVCWLLHQHRAAYDLWDHPIGGLSRFPDGPAVRDAIREADGRAMSEARAVFTISRRVSDRLRLNCGFESAPLYPPVQHAEAFYCAPAEDYLFFPSRLTTSKRQALVLEALAHTREPVRVRFVGAADDPPYAATLKAMARDLGVASRVEWLGAVGEAEKRRLYAHALGVVFPPEDEDYGLVTLEAMLASKPVVTCRDSGGTLEFVRHAETGLVAEPTPGGLAAALDELWKDGRRAERWGAAGRVLFDGLGIGWRRVLGRLLSCE